MAPGSDRFPSPTSRLLAGLAITLAAVLVYSGYTIQQIHTVRELQRQMVDRNRRDSLQLLRIQDNLGELGFAMRDMLDRTEPYPLTAWASQFARIRRDLDDAIRREAGLAIGRSPEQADYLKWSLAQFWDAVDRTFAMAEGGHEVEARQLIRDSLQSRRDALSASVSRLLVRNNDAERDAADQITAIYTRVERNVYLFLVAMLATIVLTGGLLVYYNRKLFRRITELSAQRSELSRRLITTQEETLRYLSRELHDEFGQILTAIGAMLRRIEKNDAASGSVVAAELAELRVVVQEALEKVRSLSQTLQPVILQEAGLLAALDWYIPMIERQTGVAIKYERPTEDLEMAPDSAIHVFRVLQEALNNVVRHSGAQAAQIRVEHARSAVTIEVEDSGKGIGTANRGHGIGLAAMRERAALIGGQLEIRPAASGGTLVKLTVPVTTNGEAS